MKPITVTSTGKQFATSTTAAATVLPFDSSGYYPNAIWVSATVPTYVKLTGPLSATAVAGDLLVQPADPVYLICRGYTGISALTLSGTGVLNVAPAEVGSWGDGTSLSLAFTSMTSLDSRITFSRADATTCATYFNSSGVLATAAANVPRFDYDPVTLLPRGLLIEESRTNLLLQSRDMTNAAWTKTDVTPNRTQVGIDGTANSACLMTEGTLLTANTAQSGTVSAGATVTASVVMKKGNTQWIRFLLWDGVIGGDAWFDLTNNVVGSTAARSTGSGLSSSMVNLGGGWYRCIFTVTLTGSAATSASFNICSAAANNSGTRVSGATYIVDAAQLEVASNADTAISTAASTVTRALDLPLMSGSNFSSWFNAPAFTFVATATTNARSGFPNILGLNDGAATDFLHIFIAGGASTFQVGATMQAGGVSQLNNSAGSYANGTKVKVSFAASSTGWSLVVNGVQILSGGAITMPTLLNRLAIGAKPDGTASLNGPVERVQFYPTKLTTAQQIALTS